LRARADWFNSSSPTDLLRLRDGGGGARELGEAEAAAAAAAAATATAPGLAARFSDAGGVKLWR